jgi:hypothetical protein
MPEEFDYTHGDFVPHYSPEDYTEEYTEEYTSIKDIPRFVYECLDVGDTEDCCVSCYYVYSLWKKWAAKNGVNSGSNYKLMKRLQSEIPSLTTEVNEDGSRQYSYIGIRVRDGIEEMIDGIPS